MFFFKQTIEKSLNYLSYLLSLTIIEFKKIRVMKKKAIPLIISVHKKNNKRGLVVNNERKSCKCASKCQHYAANMFQSFYKPKDYRMNTTKMIHFSKK
jgi:hypothetical protein